jgi:hypothetical protein
VSAAIPRSLSAKILKLEAAQSKKPSLIKDAALGDNNNNAAMEKFHKQFGREPEKLLLAGLTELCKRQPEAPVVGVALPACGRVQSFFKHNGPSLFSFLVVRRNGLLAG